MSPRDEQGRFVSEKDVEKYDITVWNLIEGEIVSRLRHATERQLSEIEEQYGDEPGCEIQVEELP